MPLRYFHVLLLSTKLLAQTPKLQLSLVASGLTRPSDVVVLSPTEFLVSQTDGKIQLVRNGVVQATPFLDISDKIRDPTWEGIFGIALHPDYVSNGYIYVHYSNSIMTSVFARYTRKALNPDQADPASELVFLTIPYPNGGHRSGKIGFGPDGYFYLTTGDSSSGSRGPVSNTDSLAQKLAQNLQDLHGKMLCIDVNNGNSYVIPATNPYANASDGTRPEIYALGLRNPWRWSFDRQNGDFWLGDIGQDGWEELNFTAANTPAPQNYGWPCFEGSHPYALSCPPNGTYHTSLLDYPGYTNNGGQSVSITGGFVYRGSAYPSLKGWYVYGDYATGTYWTLKRNANGTYQTILQATLVVGSSPVSFAEGAGGELYVLSLADGKLYQLVAEVIVITSVQDGSWSSPATWNCNCLPTANDDVIISNGHTVSVSQPAQVKSVTMKGKLQFTNTGTVSF